MELTFDITKANPDYSSRGVVEVIITLLFYVQAFFGSDEFFKNIGYKEGNKQVVCCDDNAVSVFFSVSLLFLAGSLFQSKSFDCEQRNECDICKERVCRSVTFKYS